MPRIDVMVGEVQFGHHLEPVYRALRNRGEYVTDAHLANPTNPVVVASYGDLKRARKLGYTRIARMEHGAGQSYGTRHGSYAGGEDADDVSLFLTPNHYSAEKWQTSYPEARVEVVGCPKLDELPRKVENLSTSPTVAISFHWDCYLVPETVSAFQHYRHVLPSLNEAFNLIGHGHPRAQAILSRRYRRAHVEFVPDFAEVCRRADLYICDNSSSLYEFAATGRPVVVLNQPMYRRDVHHGLRFWDLIPGPQVDRPQDLIATVSKALQERPQREDVMSQVYAYPDGAAERAARVLEDWA